MTVDGVVVLEVVKGRALLRVREDDCSRRAIRILEAGQREVVAVAVPQVLVHAA